MADMTEFVANYLELEQLVGENAAQFSMARETNIPAIVKKIEGVENEIEGLETKVAEDKVVVEGTLIQKITYVDEQGVQNEHNSQEEFVHFVSLPGVRPDMQVKVFPRIELADLEELVIVDHQTVYNRTVVMEIFSICYQSIKKEVVIEVPEANKKKVNLEKLKIDNFIGAEGDVISLYAEYALSEAAARINSVNCKLEDLSVDISNDKVTIKGNIVKQISYVEESSGSNTEESVKDSFSQSLQIPGARPGMEAKVYPRVENVTNKINPQERNKINQTTHVNLFVRVKETKETEVVCDIEDMDVFKDSINLYEVIGEASDDLSLVNEVELEEPVGKVISPPESNLTDVSAVISEDTIEITGTLESKIIYINDLTGNIEQGICEEIFDHKVNMYGIEEGMVAYVYPRVEYVNLEIMDDKRVKHSALLKMFTRVLDVKEQEVVLKEKREEGEIKEEERPSGATIIVYVVQKEESVFNIAKKYNVSIESIIKANKIEDPDLIYSGQKILIPFVDSS